jgi:hypothetical protein
VLAAASSWHVRGSRILAVAVILAACSGEVSPADTTVSADLGPEQVVEELLHAITEGRFEDTSALTDHRQAGLLALAEGAEVNEVVEAVDDDTGGVAANFWSGFAQSLDPSFTPEGATIEQGETTESGGERYVQVVFTDVSGEARIFYLRRDGVWKVDLLATFAPVVAERLTPRVEALLSSANPHAATLVGWLHRSTPSLEVAAANPALDATTHQSLLALIERITRAG